jgi:NADH-quinone oxidoreductase subunit A
MVRDFSFVYGRSIFKRLQSFYAILVKVISGYHLIFATAKKSMIHLLQTGLNTADATSYLPVAIQVVIAVGLIIFLTVVTHLLGPKRKTTDKLQNFASGIESHGDARQPMAIKYFLTAILFVLFDVEVIFFYPYAVNFKGLGWPGFWAVVMFVGFFLCGFIYILKKGALKWED